MMVLVVQISQLYYNDQDDVETAHNRSLQLQQTLLLSLVEKHRQFILKKIVLCSHSIMNLGTLFAL